MPRVYVDKLVTINKSAADERTGYRRYGWAEVGQTPEEMRLFRHDEKWSILLALTTTGYLPLLVYHGLIDAPLFTAWLRTTILPRMNPYVEGEITLKSIILMDNCKIHHT